MMHRIVRAAAGLLGAMLCSVSLAQEAPAADTTKPDEPWYMRGWNTAVTETTNIVKNGGWDFYLPVKTYHLPVAYTAEQRDKYNNSPAPAFGIGRGLYLDNGNWEGIYAMGFRDSNDYPSWMAGYAYRWLWSAPSINGYYGIGITAFIMSRRDYGSYTPFPAALPMFTFGFRNVAFETSYVPGGKGNGNVFFIWMKLEEKERPGS